MAPVLSKEFLNVQVNVECGLTLKRVRDMIKIYKACLSHFCVRAPENSLKEGLYHWYFLSLEIFENGCLWQLLLNILVRLFLTYFNFSP